jgi:phosphoserine aminotransferase
MIALCHNETSTGVSCSLNDIEYLHKAYPNKILAVDVTSSIGACTLNIKHADVWYFSVQKGFGLPSGLGVMFVGPQAMKKSKELLIENQKQGFFNFTNMEKRMGNGMYQTVRTPNILGIYLLGKQCERLLKTGIQKIDQRTKTRAHDLYTFFERHLHTKPFVEDKTYRSPFSLCIYVGAEHLKKYTEIAAHKGIQLGGGYGSMKTDYMRVSNYPAIRNEDIQILKEIFGN